MDSIPETDRNQHTLGTMWTGVRILCNRRLEEGTFRWPRPDAVCVRLNRQELALLLGGIDLSETRQRKWYRSVGSGE